MCRKRAVAQETGHICHVQEAAVLLLPSDWKAGQTHGSGPAPG